MVFHTLDPTVQSVRGSFSRDYPPIVEVDPGDRLIVRTLDARWNLAPHTQPGEPRRVLEHTEVGHALCGPIFVRGAQPGRVLAIHLHSLTPAEWGWTEAGREPTQVNQRLLDVTGEPVSLLWTIDRATGIATDQHAHSVEIRPFLGVIGLAPPEHGRHSTIPPRRSGGNIDCKELVAGSTLYLPIACEGALLSLGDGHAAQGDGELGETAIECGMTSEISVEIVDPDSVPAPCAITRTGRLTFGFDEALDEAMISAASSMLSWMRTLLNIDARAALALASLVVDLRITQVVNEVSGVHAHLSHAALARLQEKARYLANTPNVVHDEQRT